MGWRDKLSAGAERAATEAEKALDKGKTKAGELQIKLEMDGLAKKLGYLVFDFYRGREVDQELRQSYLDELARLEDELNLKRANAAAKAQSQEGSAQAPPPPPPPPPSSPDMGAAATPTADPAAEAAEGPACGKPFGPGSDPEKEINTPFPADG